MESAHYGAFHTDPPLIIGLVLLDEHWEPSAHRGIKNSKVGTADAYLCLGMSALSMVLEAHDLGVDSGLVTPELHPSSEILRLTGNTLCPLMVVLGYEQKGAFQKKRERKALKEIVFWEHFGKGANGRD